MSLLERVQVLTEDNLTSLDELFQLISPSRDGEENFADSLSTAAEHLISLLEGRDRPVAGSTYKELLELIHLVDGCGYFERVRKTEEASAGEKGEDKYASAEEVVEVDGLQGFAGQVWGDQCQGQGHDYQSISAGAFTVETGLNLEVVDSSGDDGECCAFVSEVSDRREGCEDPLEADGDGEYIVSEDFNWVGLLDGADVDGDTRNSFGLSGSTQHGTSQIDIQVTTSGPCSSKQSSEDQLVESLKAAFRELRMLKWSDEVDEESSEDKEEIHPGFYTGQAENQKGVGRTAKDSGQEPRGWSGGSVETADFGGSAGVLGTGVINGFAGEHLGFGREMSVGGWRGYVLTQGGFGAEAGGMGENRVGLWEGKRRRLARGNADKMGSSFVAGTENTRALDGEVRENTEAFSWGRTENAGVSVGSSADHAGCFGGRKESTGFCWETKVNSGAFTQGSAGDFGATTLEMDRRSSGNWTGHEEDIWAVISDSSPDVPGHKDGFCGTGTEQAGGLGAGGIGHGCGFGWRREKGPSGGKADTAGIFGGGTDWGKEVWGTAQSSSWDVWGKGSFLGGRTENAGGFGGRGAENSGDFGGGKTENTGSFLRGRTENSGGFGEEKTGNTGGFPGGRTENTGGLGGGGTENNGGFGREETEASGGFLGGRTENTGGFGGGGTESAGGFCGGGTESA